LLVWDSNQLSYAWFFKKWKKLYRHYHSFLEYFQFFFSCAFIKQAVFRFQSPFGHL
jgi:hypothetical protein